jgi:streptogramin lyase
VRIDPTTNEVIASIELPDRLCQGFVASDDAIWACAANGLVRIDPATNKVSGSVPVKGAQLAYRPAFGGGMVWALGSTGMVGDTVLQLDPATEQVTSYPASGSAGAMAYGFDALWLSMPNAGSIVRMDPGTGETKVLATGLAGPRAIVIGSDSLWVALHGSGQDEAVAGDSQVVRIDPTTGDVLAEFDIGGSPQWGVDLWAGEGGILVRSTNPWMVRIDEATSEIVETITSDVPVQGPITEGFGSIWTVELERDVVYRMSP